MKYVSSWNIGYSKRFAFTNQIDCHMLCFMKPHNKQKTRILYSIYNACQVTPIRQ